IADAHLIVQMVANRDACLAHRTNLLSTLNLLSWLNSDPSQMSIQRVDCTAFRCRDVMLDHDHVAIKIRRWPEYAIMIAAREIHRTVSRCDHTCPRRIQEIDTMMDRRLAFASPTVGETALWLHHAR